jgi:biotin/methionine sulfoxide reductase
MSNPPAAPTPGQQPGRGAARRVAHNSHWGPFTALVEQGRVVGVDAAADDPAPARMLASIADGVHSPVRVRRPAVRLSWLTSGPGSRTDLRGHDPFVEVDWDVALDLVAGELRRVADRHGHPAIFGGSYGWASAGRFHHAKTQLNRFLGLFGGYTGQTQNYSYAAAAVILPHVVGDASAVNGSVSSWDTLEAHTRLWVMFGGGVLRTSQVESGGMGRHTAGEWLARLRAAGTEFVAVSPLADDVPDFLDAQQLAIRPTTDTALMLGLAHELIRTDRHDLGFLTTRCHGWLDLLKYLDGSADGVVKDAAWAAGICGLPVDEIRSLAARMADHRTLITSTWSLQRAEHGEQPYWATIALAAVLGQIGLPGGGYGFGYGDTALVGQPKAPFSMPALASGANPAHSSIPVARIADMLLHPGEEYDFNGKRSTYPDIRLVYWAGGNPFHHHQDLNRLERAWSRPETVIVHEPWWTSTARRADIVLPATTTLERNDIACSSKDTVITAMYQAVPPVGEARDDYEIFHGLAQRLGFEETFTGGRDERGWLEFLWERSRTGAARNGIELPEFADFWETGRVDLPAMRSHTVLEQFRQDPEKAPLRTPSGRIELYSETIAGFEYDDCPGHPAWLDKLEWLGAPLAERFPLHLISNQPATRLHSQLDMGAASRRSKIADREPCRMNPADAAARGIADGDVIEIFNDRGRCLAGVRVSDAVRPGVLQLSTGAWYDPRPAGPGEALPLEVHGNPNVLTRDAGTSALAQGPSAHSTLVQAARYAGTPPPVEVFDPPAVVPDPRTRPTETVNTGSVNPERTTAS